MNIVRHNKFANRLGRWTLFLDENIVHDSALPYFEALQNSKIYVYYLHKGYTIFKQESVLRYAHLQHYFCVILILLFIKGFSTNINIAGAWKQTKSVSKILLN